MFLQGHGMTIDLSRSLEHPPLERDGGAKKTMAAGAAIVLKNYARIKMKRR